MSGSESPHAIEFDSTHWSLVIAAGCRGTVESDRALERLCRQYWPPLYAYVLRRVADLHEAQDLTQAFFERVLEKGYFAQAVPDRGRFRAFLLTAFKHFLANHWEQARAQKRGGAYTRIPFDFASQTLPEPSSRQTPEQTFEREWAVTLLGHVLERLQREMERSGKARQFELLKQALVRDDSAVPLPDAAAELGLSPAAARMAVSRLRARYRELLRDEILQTVSSREEVDDELRRLFAAFES